MIENQRRDAFSAKQQQKKQTTTNLVIKVAHKKPHLSFPLHDYLPKMIKKAGSLEVMKGYFPRELCVLANFQMIFDQ